MNYKQLCATLGEPDLPLGAFEHCGDRKIKPQGGGPSTPSSTTQTSIPEYAQPYVQNMLGSAQGQIYNMGQTGADESGNPTYGITSLKSYQPYPGALTAGTSPLQQQSYGAASNMEVPQQYNAASNMAQQAGLASLGAGNYQGANISTGQWNPAAAQQYMSPYMQSVVDINKAQALRDAAQQGTQRAAQFTNAGAFGGSRQGIADAEASRNLNQQMQDIQNKGTQEAYVSGMQGFQSDQQRALAAQQAAEQSRQFGANLGMQGRQQAISAAGTLGQLGGQQAQAGMDIAKLQNQFGTQQQQTGQQAIDAQMQQYAAAQNYPYKQLGFLSDMLRGLPLSNTNVYQAAPSTTSQMAGLGLAGLGLYNNTR